MVGIFTSGYAAKAERLAASCEEFGLHYELHEVRAIHRSISPRGTDELAYTKPNFIRHMLAVHKRAVLYLDADCEFASQPGLIDELVRTRCDFAIYNWLADSHTDAFAPIEAPGGAVGPSERNRFYRFSHSVDFTSTSQMVPSGMVQLYRNSIAARSLLTRWHRTIERFPRSADDKSLSFTFNNLTRRSWLSWVLKARWLPKPYARISWWIYAEPVINHPDPAGTDVSPNIKDPRGQQQVYRTLLERTNVPRLFPRDCIIDTQQQMLCKLVDNELVPLQPTDQKFWL